MIDQTYDRDYQLVRPALNASFSRSIRTFLALIGTSFKVLNRIEYAAPWDSRRVIARGN